jgi:hypothetical protein
VTRFPLARANEALVGLKADAIDGTGVLVVTDRDGLAHRGTSLARNASAGEAAGLS